MTEVGRATAAALEELLAVARPKPGALLVVGCSTSVVLGRPIGKGSSVAVAEAILSALTATAAEVGLRLAVQCCEHLNRALVVTADGPDIGPEVSAFPQPGAGGTLAALAMLTLDGARLVANVSATLGLDIGLTLIGMHLRPVVVPVHIRTRVGEAVVTGGYSRPPLIGGRRAVYTREEALAALASLADRP